MKKCGGISINQCAGRSTCPITNTLDLIGDKWTLLVIRDLLFLGKRQYNELAQSPERIPTSILADRLKRLEETGLVEKQPYQQHPVRYEYRLTDTGVDLLPLLQEMIRWGNKHIEGTAVPPSSFYQRVRGMITGQKKPQRSRKS